MKAVFLSLLLSGILSGAMAQQALKPKPLAKKPAANVAGPTALAQGIGLAERGKLVYAKECLSCHQADGGGVPHLNPPLSECSWVIGDKKKIISIVLHGMTDRLPIDDEYYSNSMAPHSNLSNQQIADVLTYIRQNFGNKATAVSAAEVKAVRDGVKKK